MEHSFGECSLRQELCRTRQAQSIAGDVLQLPEPWEGQEKRAVAAMGGEGQEKWCQGREGQEKWCHGRAGQGPSPDLQAAGLCIPPACWAPRGAALGLRRVLLWPSAL